jgi:hypothetical protein
VLTRNQGRVPRRRRFAPAGPIGDEKMSRVGVGS